MKRTCLSHVLAAAATLCLLSLPARAQDEKAKEYLGKVTLGLYSVPGSTTYDVNARYKLDTFMAWLGCFIDPNGTSIGRLGVEYDFQTSAVLAVPSVVVGTNGFVGGSFYSEIGSDVFAIAGYSQTNLKPAYSLTFDPNESVELGLGMKLANGGRLMAFTIFDVRLGTGQQDTHLLWRTPLPRGRRLTVDLMYKSGHTDEAEFVRGSAVTVVFDWPSVFVKVAFDQYVNFSSQDMVRIGGGFRF